MLQEKQLDKSIPVPLYFQLKKLILEEMEAGTFPVGSMIPTENELIEMFGISRTTVRQAITELVQEGKLYRIKSKGTFVSKPKIDQDYVRRAQSFNAPNNEEIIRSGRVPSTEVISLSVVQMPQHIAKFYPASSSDRAVCLYRKRCADGKPIVRVITYLPISSCSYVLEHDFMKEGLHEVLALHEDTRVCRISRTCEAIPADLADVEILGVKQGSPIHFFTNIGYNSRGKVIEYSNAYCRGDQSRLHFEIILDQNSDEHS